jgi:hypothetical protein
MLHLYMLSLQRWRLSQRLGRNTRRMHIADAEVSKEIGIEVETALRNAQ